MAVNQFKRMEKKLDDIAMRMDSMGFQEYMEYVQDKSGAYKRAFASGLLRGLGAAVGFTLLGALLLYILRWLAGSSIPLIGEFIAEIIKIVDSKT